MNNIAYNVDIGDFLRHVNVNMDALYFSRYFTSTCSSLYVMQVSYLTVHNYTYSVNCDFCISSQLSYYIGYYTPNSNITHFIPIPQSLSLPLKPYTLPDKMTNIIYINDSLFIILPLSFTIYIRDLLSLYSHADKDE